MCAPLDDLTMPSELEDTAICPIGRSGQDRDGRRTWRKKAQEAINTCKALVARDGAREAGYQNPKPFQ